MRAVEEAEARDWAAVEEAVERDLVVVIVAGKRPA